jgi:type IV pilus assembly protein PilY1
LSWNAETGEYEGVGYPSAYATDNYFFMLRDFPGDATWLQEEFDESRCADAFLCMNSLFLISGDATPTAAELGEKKGWALAMREGEQIVTSAITVFGVSTFSTHTPTDPRLRAACTSDLGTARVYNIKYANAASGKLGVTNRSEEVVGGGLPPSPVAGKVQLDDEDPNDNIDAESAFFIIGGGPTSSLEGGEPVQPPPSALPKSITYWYIKK